MLIHQKISRLLRHESQRSRCPQDRRQNQRCQERTDPFQQNGTEIVSRDGKLLPQVAEQHRSHCKASLLAASGEKPVQVEQRMRRSLQQNKGNGGVRQSADPL